jgi:Fic family protein
MLLPDPPLSGRLAKDLERLDGLHGLLEDEVGRAVRFDGPIRRMARAETIAASTSIEGYGMPVARAAAVLDGARADAGDEAEQAVAAYGRAMDHVLALALDPMFRWDRRVLLDLHFDCCQWQRGISPGRIRTGPIRVVGPAGEARYEGPPADAIPGLLDELVAYLAARDGHRVVRAAMAHLHLASIHAFRDGNGRHARVVQSLVLAREGLWSPEFTSMEPYLASHTGEYHAALERAQGGAFGRWGSAAAWVRFCVNAHLDQAERRLDLLIAASRRWTALERVAIDRGWPDRLVIAMEQALVTGTLARRSYGEEADVSPATASADLRRLLDAGLIEQEGQGRSIRYRPSDALAREAG